MDAKYAEYLETNFLRPIKVSRKEEYYSDIQSITESLTFFLGRKYTIAYEFVRETERMLINAVALFEKGYFDASFYMLRQTLEICMTIAYFLELPDGEREEKFKDWKGSVEKFPTVGEIRRILDGADYSVDFKDFKAKMPMFFKEFREIYAKLNKYTHKQGYRYFYSIRWREGDRKDIDNNLLDNFVSLLEKCIGNAWMFRLMIDPLPVLLMDDEIEYRIADPMLNPIPFSVLDKYIGSARLEEYMSTNLYLGFRADIVEKREKLSEATYTYAKMDLLERKDIPEVLKQSHLLTLRQKIQLLLIAHSPQVAVIHSYDGLWSCFTDVKSNRNDHSDSSKEFEALRNSGQLCNQPFKGVYATVVKVHNDFYTLEHNEPFDAMRVITLAQFASKLDEIINYEEMSLERMVKT